MPETEVLRIEGNVTVPKGIDASGFKGWINSLFKEWKCHFEGNIVPQDSPTGMRLYRVEEVEGYKEKITTIEGLLFDERTVNIENNKTFKALSEKYSELVKAHRLLTQVEHSTALSNIELQKVNFALRSRLEDSPIKAGLKRIWKWFKGLVGK